MFDCWLSVVGFTTLVYKYEYIQRMDCHWATENEPKINVVIPDFSLYCHQQVKVSNLILPPGSLCMCCPLKIIPCAVYTPHMV